MVREMRKEDWESIAKDRFGEWQSTTIMERRNGIM